MRRRLSGLEFALVPALSGLLPGCFTTREVRPEALRALDGPAVVRVHLRGGEVFRALVDPADTGPDSIRYRPLRYGPRSWVVRCGGWPMVYTAGKYLRYQTEGEKREVPLAEVESLEIERYSWPLTLLSLPLTLPVGILDFLVHSIRFGFEDVDVSDTFSRTPPSRVK